MQCPACACSDGESTIFTRVEAPFLFLVCGLVLQQLRKKEKESVEVEETYSFLDITVILFFNNYNVSGQIIATIPRSFVPPNGREK